LNDPTFDHWVTCNESLAGDNILAVKMEETYGGAGRHLLRLIERRKDEIGGKKHCDRRAILAIMCG